MVHISSHLLILKLISLDTSPIYRGCLWWGLNQFRGKQPYDPIIKILEVQFR